LNSALAGVILTSYLAGDGEASILAGVFFFSGDFFTFAFEVEAFEADFLALEDFLKIDFFTELFFDERPLFSS